MLYVWNVRIGRKIYGMLELAEKLHILLCINSTGNCVHYMYGMSGFPEKLNVQICENSTRNCVCYMYGMLGLAEKYTEC